MGIPLTLQAPPLFDRSLVPAYQTNFNRIRDAFGRVMGSEVQSGQHTQAAIGLAVAHFNIAFPVSFSQATAPVVVCVPVFQAVTQWLVNVATTAPGFFSAYCQTVGGGASAENLILNWVAWYP